MICPNCRKIVAQDSTECPFCKMQLYSQPTEQGTANAPVPPQYVQAPYAPYQQPYGVPVQPLPPTHEQKYQTLGGFLNFLVVMWKYVAPILSVFLLISIAFSTFLGIAKLENHSWESLKPIIGYAVTEVYYIVCIVLSCIVAVKIEKRNPSFLDFWQKTNVALSLIAIIIHLIFSDLITVPIYACLYVLQILIWNLYFTKSVRVSVYMGSDEYLRGSFFNKKSPLPKTDRAKSEKTKIILLAVILIIVYEALVGVNFYLQIKKVAPQLKSALESSQSVNTAKKENSTYTDEKTGATFIIPKGLEENKELENENFPLVMESAHTNFECFGYSSHDMYEDIAAADKQGLKRSDINNETFTRKQIEDFATQDTPDGVDASSVKTTVERIGNYEYYVVSFEYNNQQGDRVKCTNYVHYYNGYEYFPL